MSHTINLNWLQKMSFESSIKNHKIKLDLPKDAGGDDTGPTPKPLLLVALAGCTAMDVVPMLQKMRVDFKGLSISVTGEVSEEHPKYYTKMHIIYEFKGENLPKDKLEHAVKLSQDKYCGVGALFKKAIPVTYEIKY